MVAALNVLAAVVTLALCFLVPEGIPLGRSVARASGLVAVYGGLGLAVWAGLHLGRAIGGLVAPRLDRLVTSGPYRFVRHPVYVGTAIALVGVAVVARSLPGLLAVFVLFVPSEIHRASREERSLADAFGPTWTSYVSRTGAFLPRVPR